MVKGALFYIQQKGSLTPQLFFHEGFGRAPAAVDSHGNPQDGGRAKGWLIPQQVVVADLDHVHHRSPPFTCLIKGRLVQNK